MFFNVKLTAVFVRHSATLMPDDTLVIFGGWDAPVAHNDAFSLDLTMFEFEKLVLTGTPPSARRF
jgi:hypothetical protein